MSTELFKVVTIGDANVGKSAIGKQLAEGTFSEIRASTIGIDIFTWTFVSESMRTVRLQVWDTAGQERYNSLIPSYLRLVDVILLVFDITSRKSFNNIRDWANLATKSTQNSTVLWFLVGNKIDLEHKREVETDEAAELAIELGAIYHETTAKDNESIVQLFTVAIEHLPPKSQAMPERNDTVTTNTEPKNETQHKKIICGC